MSTAGAPQSTGGGAPQSTGAPASTGGSVSTGGGFAWSDGWRTHLAGGSTDTEGTMKRLERFESPDQI